MNICESMSSGRGGQTANKYPQRACRPVKYIRIDGRPVKYIRIEPAGRSGRCRRAAGRIRQKCRLEIRNAMAMASSVIDLPDLEMTLLSSHVTSARNLSRDSLV